MSLRTICLALILLPALGAAAGACELPGFKRLDALRLKRPVPGAVIQGFGMQVHPLLRSERMHPGLDMDGAMGEPVVAAATGRVEDAGPRGEYGNKITIDHGDGLVTAYAHLSRLDVKAGDCVVAGQTIGRVGTTGVTSGPRVHFEVRIGDTAIDPGPMLAPGLAPRGMEKAGQD